MKLVKHDVGRLGCYDTIQYKHYYSSKQKLENNCRVTQRVN